MVVMTMAYWSLRHKQPIHWDENEYLNVNYRDLIAKRAGGWSAYASSLLHTYSDRPPAYRLLVAPMYHVFFRDIPETTVLFDVGQMTRDGETFDYSTIAPEMLAKSWVPSYCRM